MQTEFKAIVLSNEINLNKIAQHFGINKDFKWEESLQLKSAELEGILRQPDRKTVYFFHFGSMVFLNFQHHEMMDVINYMKTIEVGAVFAQPFKYVDEYSINVDDQERYSVNNECLVTRQQAEYQFDIVALILAKSVALEKIEADISYLLDDIEELVNDLHKGKLAASDEKLAKVSARILGFKVSTVSYIMILDKPVITWNHEEASELFEQLSKLFELNDRYGRNRHKIDTLMDITEVFSGLAHAKRGNRLEWAVIILIAIEIVLSLVDLFLKK